MAAAGAESSRLNVLHGFLYGFFRRIPKGAGQVMLLAAHGTGHCHGDPAGEADGIAVGVLYFDVAW